MARTIEQAIEAVDKAAEELEWGVSHSFQDNIPKDGEVVPRTCFEFENWTSGGQDFTATAFMDGADVGSLLDSLDEEAEGFDADEEAGLYIREDMLGRNGVPHDIRGLLDDMEERGDMLLNLANQMRQELEHLTGNGDGDDI